MKAPDTAATSALRSALAAIDNAEALDSSTVTAVDTTHPRVAGGAPGVAAGEAPRRVLSVAEIEAVLRTEISERESAAAAHDSAPRPEAADRLRQEVRILSAIVDDAR